MGLSAGVPVENLNALIDTFNNAADHIKHEDLVNGTVNAEALSFASLTSDQATKDLFNTLNGYVGVRGEQVNAIQLEEEARFQRQIEADRAAQNNLTN